MLIFRHRRIIENNINDINEMNKILAGVLPFIPLL